MRRMSHKTTHCYFLVRVCMSWVWIVDYLTMDRCHRAEFLDGFWAVVRRTNDFCEASINHRPFILGARASHSKHVILRRNQSAFFLATAAGCGCHLFTYAPLKFIYVLHMSSPVIIRKMGVTKCERKKIANNFSYEICSAEAARICLLHFVIGSHELNTEKSTHCTYEQTPSTHHNCQRFVWLARATWKAKSGNKRKQHETVAWVESNEKCDIFYFSRRCCGCRANNFFFLSHQRDEELQFECVHNFTCRHE